MIGSISGFDWDEGNRAKCCKHGLSLKDIEHLFHGTIAVFPDPRHSAAEERFAAIGETADGRKAFVIFTLRQKNGLTFIRPISARFMHRKEVEHYEKETARARQRR
ncbi:MAG: hypothetical protein BGP06_18055 [Rhizobiales bacterium 65-9]|nr:BrnT family toxin [Hyphomicrobiales bacterium]OJY34742.1 MAG: hypothetical protein BGP06_18055 [Rhizobiales bacterium 65-9]